MLFYHRVTPSIQFASTHLYTQVERGTVRVKCLAQEQNTNHAIRWIVIYPVDSVIQPLNNWALVDSVIHPLNNRMGTGEFEATDNPAMQI